MADFTPRTTMPNTIYKPPTISWYSDYASDKGGYYGISSSKGTPYGNCTWYCYSRLGEILGKYDTSYSNLGNGGQWYSNAQSKGLSVGQTPQLGSVMCWASSSGTHAGHVAIVEYIDDNFNVKASMSAAGSGGFWFAYGGYATRSASRQWTTVASTSMFYKSNNYKYPLYDYTFQGFIYLTGEPTPKPPEPTPPTPSVGNKFWLPNRNNRRNFL